MMTFALLAIIAIAVVFWAARRLRSPHGRVRSLSDFAAHSRPVDIECFRNLVDPEEESFLRTHLTGRDFRRVQRSRMLAAIEYVRCTAHNARLLLQLADAARSSPDREIRVAAVRLANCALQLRVYSLLSLFLLGLRVLLPTVPLRPSDIAKRYGDARDCMAGLTRIEQPSAAAQVEAAL